MTYSSQGRKMLLPTRNWNVSQKFIEDQTQILRLTTPKLKDVWGPVRSE